MRKKISDLTTPVGILITLAIHAGCASDEPSQGQPTQPPPDTIPPPAQSLPPATSCAPGKIALEGGGCAPAGLPADASCQPGTAAHPDGPCQAPGIPTGQCGDGFSSDDEGGCRAILPDMPCPDGQYALPGETECHDIAPCGSGKWGDIPITADTVYVDGSWQGESTGAQDAPWTSIQEAIDHAPADALIAIAAGTYIEDLLVEDTPVTLWGRCPGMVEIVSSDIGLTIHESGTRVHNVAVTGEGIGIWLTADSDTFLEGVWVHHTTGEGIVIEGDSVQPEENAIKIKHTIVEDTTTNGLAVYGSTVRFEASTVREERASLGWGAGIGAYEDYSDTIPAIVNVLNSVIESNDDIGAVAFGSTLSVSSSVVRNTVPYSDPESARGISAYSRPTDGCDAVLMIRNSVISGHIDTAIRATSSQLSVYRTTIRDNDGNGLRVTPDDDTLKLSLVTIEESVIAHNHGTGIAADGAHTNIRSSVVRGHTESEWISYGDGINVSNDFKLSNSSASIQASIIEDNTYAGLYADGIDVAVEDSVIRRTRIPSTASDSYDRVGYGIIAGSNDDSERPTTLTVHRSHITDNIKRGIVLLGVNATVDASIVSGTTPGEDEESAATGISVHNNPSSFRRSELTLRRSLIEGNVGKGIALRDGTLLVEGTVIRENQFTADPALGVGIKTGTPTSRPQARILGSIIERNSGAGVFSVNTDLEVTDTIVRDIAPPTSQSPTTYLGNDGFGIYMTGISGSASITRSEISNAHTGGLVVWGGLDVHIADVRISDVFSHAGQRFGDCIAVVGQPLPARVYIQDSTLRNCERAGVSNFGSDVTLDAVTIECTGMDLTGSALTARDFGYNITDTTCGCDEEQHECIVDTTNGIQAIPERSSD